MTAEIQSTDLDERISRIVQKLLRGELPELFAQRGQAVRVAVDGCRAGIV